MTYEVNLIVQAAIMLGVGFALLLRSAAAGRFGRASAREVSRQDPQTLNVEEVGVRPAEIEA